MQGTLKKESRIRPLVEALTDWLAQWTDGQYLISLTKKNAGLTSGQRCLQESDKLWAQNVAERYEKLIKANPLKSSLTRS
jgi:hypothetical protein